MASPAILKIDIIADATKAIKAMEQTGGAAQTAGSKFGGVGKAVATGLATGAIVGFGKASFSAAEEAAASTARLEQVFSSMGDTTGEAASAAADYASALSQKIGVDDEAIMAAQAQLATFGAVSDETARAAGIFDRTTVAAADLAAAGFGTLDSNSVQLGKALQDPTKGLAALSKSGVTFTDAQKAQIAAMQKSGDLLGAQKVVLQAVEGQVKGTAEATATGSDKMAIAFGEVQEQVGGFLLPAMTKLTEIFVKYKAIILPVGAALLAAAAAVKLYSFAEKAGTVIKGVATAAQWAWNAATFAGLVPLLLVVAAIAALIAIGVLIVKNWDTIKAAAKAVWDFMQTAWDAILGIVEGVFNWIRDNWPLLLAILTGPIGIAVLLITTHWQTIKDAIKAVFDWIKDVWSTVLDLIKIPVETAKTAVETAWTAIKDAAKAVWDWIKDTWSTVLDMIKKPVEDAKTAVETAWTAIKDAAKAVWDWINENWKLLLGIITGPIGAAVLLVQTHWTTIKDAAKAVYDWLKDTWSTITDTIKLPFETAATAIKTVWDPLKTFFTELPDKIKTAFEHLADIIKAPFRAAFNAIAGFWNTTVGSLSFSIPSWVPGIGGNSFNVPNIPTLMTGGTVLRTGLAVVHAGEQFSGVGHTFGSGTTVVNHIHVATTGLGADAPSIQRAVANALRGYTARNGPLDIPVRGVA